MQIELSLDIWYKIKSGSFSPTNASTIQTKYYSKKYCKAGNTLNTGLKMKSSRCLWSNVDLESMK